MPSTLKPGSKAFIIINPVAGFTDASQMKKICEEQFHAAGWHTRFYFTRADEQKLSEVVTAEITAGANLVVAVGGDGTIAEVAGCLLHTNVPLGIIPTGTWNAIARHLTLPASPQHAIALMTGKHSLRRLDMMQVGKTFHAMNVGVGFSALMAGGANRTQKRKFGNMAYFSHILKQLFGLQMQRYSIEADGVRHTGRATEILIANYGVVGLRFLEDRLKIHPDDGKVDILIMKARTVLDLPSLIWQLFVKRNKRTPKYRKITAHKKITIITKPPAPVQADGESLGQTPVKVKVLPRAVLVIAP